MPDSGAHDQLKFYLIVAGAITAMAVAALLGFWLGGAPSSPNPIATIETARTSPAPAEDTGGPDSESEPDAAPVPLYFFASALPGADIEAVVREAKLAARAGVHRYVLSVPMPWEETREEIDNLLRPIRRIVEADPQSELILHVVLNPPPAWLAANPEAAIRVDGVPQPYPCVASDLWMQRACTTLDTLLDRLGKTPVSVNVRGFMIGALSEGLWYQSVKVDDSETNQARFGAWLGSRYADDAALQTAWDDDSAALETAAIPQRPDHAESPAVFLDIPKDLPYIDFLRYTSENSADAIAAIAYHLKQRGEATLLVLAPYGYSFEASAGPKGHCALELLLDSDIDGFVSPVSYHDRGPGGAGGFMGPVHSARNHGKQWFLIDDTRTGITRDPSTGIVERQPGLRLADVYNVQRRNFAAALASGLGLFWADADSKGHLLDDAMWGRFKGMRQAYQTLWPDGPELDPGQVSEPGNGPRDVVLMVVVDEDSRFYLSDSAQRDRTLHAVARDCALRVGVPTQFCLLNDVLTETAPVAPVYLFVNVFHLDEPTRQRLHEILRTQEAAAIWLYAPGYIADKPSVEHVAATTGFPVKALEQPAHAGSVYDLPDGIWIPEDETFGESVLWDPLFYIDYKPNQAGDEPDPVLLMSKYRESEKPSSALEFREDGWASVFIAEPHLDENFLREIIRTLGEHLYLGRTDPRCPDVCHFGPDLVVIHAGQDGNHEIDLGVAHTVNDLLDTDKGWLNKRILDLPLALGETRVLRLSRPDLEEEEEPTPQPSQQVLD